MDNQNIENITSIKDIKSIFINILPIFYKLKNSIGITSFCAYRIKRKYGTVVFDKYLHINNDYFKVKTLFKRGIGFSFKKYKYYFNLYNVKINKDEILNYPPQNLIKVSFKRDDNEIIMPVVYNLLHRQVYKGKTSKVYKINKDLVCYFRQAKLNSIALTVRSSNTTDKFSHRCKILFAKLLSMITPKSDITLLYEKGANKYEESAATLYERLIDLGYQNSHFIIKKDSKHVEFIKERYKKNIIWAYTFNHYYKWFKCRKFIGTESVPHSMELRAANQYITKKMIKKKYKQVFLQHGVMYMVALDSVSRSAFRKGGNEQPIDAKIVVSSKKEADHFVELGGFDYEDLYISGLPFYDRTIKKPEADKIVIMLTWRPWDYNVIVSDYKKSTYYKMTKKIINSIPSEYKDKVYILPHPLILNKFRNTDLDKWIPEILSYDKILEDTALLITDYSSIAYSAFYRGSNIIFCWEELHECMEKYGSHLMLNDKNVFGDVSYQYEDLAKLMKKNYLKPQTEKYKKKYKSIVTFSDNKNTDRLIEFLKKDNMI